MTPAMAAMVRAENAANKALLGTLNRATDALRLALLQPGAGISTAVIAQAEALDDDAAEALLEAKRHAAATAAKSYRKELAALLLLLFVRSGSSKAEAQTKVSRIVEGLGGNGLPAGDHAAAAVAGKSLASSWAMAMLSGLRKQAVTRPTLRLVGTVADASAHPAARVPSPAVLRPKALLIGTTETAVTTNAKRDELARIFEREHRDLAQQVAYRWDAELDKRTCSTCEELNGKEWDSIDAAPSCPSHIRCRCVLVPFVKR